VVREHELVATSRCSLLRIVGAICGRSDALHARAVGHAAGSRQCVAMGASGIGHATIYTLRHTAIVRGSVLVPLMLHTGASRARIAHAAQAQ
jgi:hypothetical protein